MIEETYTAGDLLTHVVKTGISVIMDFASSPQILFLFIIISVIMFVGVLIVSGVSKWFIKAFLSS